MFELRVVYLGSAALLLRYDPVEQVSALPEGESQDDKNEYGDSFSHRLMWEISSIMNKSLNSMQRGKDAKIGF
jgi:hypothetical protein